MGQDDARSASVILFYASSYTPSTSGQLLHLPEEPYDLAENGTVRDHDRFHRVVFGLQADLVSSWKKRFTVASSSIRATTMSPLSAWDWLHHHVIAVENSRLNHAFATNLQHEDFFIVGQIARDGEEVFNVFHRQIGLPAVTLPSTGAYVTSLRIGMALSSSSMARGFVGSADITSSSSLFRWPCTVELELNPTA